MLKVKTLLKKYDAIPVAVKATIWFMFCSIVQKSISLVTIPIFTRLMTAEQYGQFSVYNSWLSIFSIVVTLRLNYSVFNKGMSKYKDDRDSYTCTMQMVTTGIALLLFAIYLLFKRPIEALTELPTFIMVAMFVELVFWPAIDFWTIRTRYEYLYKPVVFRTLLMAFLNAFLGVVAVLLFKEKGYARILTVVFVNSCFGLVLYIYTFTRAKRKFVPEYAKFALLFNLPLLLHYLSLYILDQFDKIMIQKMVGMAAAGIYSVAYSAGMIMKIVTQSINNALVPWQYEKLEKRQFKELEDVLLLVYILVSICALIFSAFAPELMKILADEKYYEAVYVIPPVALGLVFSFMYTIFGNIEFYYDKNIFAMYISSAGAVLNIVLNYIGIRLFGYIAAAYTTLICYALFALGHYIYMTVSVKKALHIDRVFNSTKLLVLSLIVLAFGLLMILFYDHVIIRFGVIVALLIVAYYNKNRIINSLRSIRAIKR